MHAVSLTAELLSQIQSQRGRLHPFERLDMGHTAHIAVDLQNGFMEPGAPVEVPVAREIVPNVNAISAALRAAGGTIVYLRFKTDPGALASWTSFYEHMFNRAGRDSIRRMTRCSISGMRSASRA